MDQTIFAIRTTHINEQCQRQLDLCQILYSNIYMHIYKYQTNQGSL